MSPKKLAPSPFQPQLSFEEPVNPDTWDGVNYKHGEHPQAEITENDVVGMARWREAIAQAKELRNGK